MMSAEIKPGRAPRVLAVFSFRYDAHLVPAMIRNIAPMVDGWIAYDDRASNALYSNEVHRRAMLLRAARNAGASWVLAVDPDERFEDGLSGAMHGLITGGGATVHTFALREMYAPDTYRIDGIWGEKRQGRLLSLEDGVVEPKGDLHLPWASFIPKPRLGHTSLNLYHLKMIAPQRRRARAALYKHLDPAGQMQKLGYDYLADEDGACFERIPEGRGYTPDHVDDGDLWMPRLAAHA